MSYTPLAAEAIERLKQYNTPTVSNAIEVFNVRPWDVGYLPHRIRSLTPDLGVMVGYAVTSQTRAAPPDPDVKGPDLNADYLRYVASMPGPKVAIGQDLDPEPGLGAQFGEVNATIHKKLGCVGHITDGCPRDVDEVEAMGFQLFGLNLCVSHAYVRLVGFGTPVTIAGVEIRPGDLIHADKHGVCIIPHGIADKVADACAQVEQLERPLLDCCRSDDFDLERYIQLRAEMKAKIRE
jgi:regulator of RNase E activity RraA